MKLIIINNYNVIRNNVKKDENRDFDCFNKMFFFMLFLNNIKCKVNVLFLCLMGLVFMLVVFWFVLGCLGSFYWEEIKVLLGEIMGK